MMNEINALVWPSPNGIGIMDPASWQQTVDVSLGAGIIKAAPPAEAYRTDLATKALEGITDDTKGADFAEGRGRGHRGRQLALVVVADARGPAREGRPSSFRERSARRGPALFVPRAIGPARAGATSLRPAGPAPSRFGSGMGRHDPPRPALGVPTPTKTHSSPIRS